MAGLNAIQILRGTSSTLNSSTQTLLPGQLVYNKDKNYLAIGSDIKDGDSSPLNKSPIEVRRLVAYYEDTDNSIGANTTPIFSIGDSSLGGSGHNLTLEYKGTGSDAPDNYVALNDSTFFTNVQRINLTATTALSLRSEAMFVDIESSSVLMTANRINIVGGEPMQSGIGTSTIAVGLNVTEFGTIRLTTTREKGGTNNVEEAITLQSNTINLQSYSSAGIRIINASNQVLLNGDDIGFSNGANIITVDQSNTTVGMFKFPTIPESNYNTLYTLATTANIANINDTLQTNTTTIYAPINEYSPENEQNYGVAVRYNGPPFTSENTSTKSWSWREIKDIYDDNHFEIRNNSSKLLTETAIYNGLPYINGKHDYYYTTHIYAPEDFGDKTQLLCGSGNNTKAPTWKTLYAHYFTINLKDQTITPPPSSSVDGSDGWGVYGYFYVVSSVGSSASTISSLSALITIVGDNLSNGGELHIPFSGVIYKHNTAYNVTCILVGKDKSTGDAYGSLRIPMYSASSENYEDAVLDLLGSSILHGQVPIL